MSIKDKIRQKLPLSLHDWLILMRQKDRGALKKNRLWSDSGRGKRAWVLATGPSIKQQDLSLLQGEDCFSVSNFFLHDCLAEIGPKAHFFAPYHPPLVKENFLEWLAKADAALPSSTAVVLGLSDKAMVETSGVFSVRDKYYLAVGAKRYDNIDCERLVPYIQTGPQMILSLLIYAGYQEIFLLGCDHNTLRNYGDTVENFYSPSEDSRVNAISGSGWLPVTEHLQTQITVFQIYENFIKANPTVRIVNCSPSSWLRFTEMPFSEFTAAVGLRKFTRLRDGGVP